MAARYIALIPAFEPDRKMLGVIADLGKRGFDIVLVDDGSGTEYSELFEEAAEKLPGKYNRGAILLIHDTNRGKGAALKTGLEFISNFMVIRGEERQNVVVTVDADGQHLARDVANAASTAGSKPGTLVLGSRWLSAPGQSGCERIPLRSRFGNAVTRKVFRLAAGTEIRDTQTGLRAFTADLIPELLSIRGDRYEYEINMLMECITGGIPVEEIGIETVYLDGNESSHFNALRDSYKIYREIVSHTITGRETAKQALKFSASSFASFLIDYAMYALLLLIGPGIIFANIGARAISSVANFTINRKLVFRSGKNIAGSAMQYFALAAFILAGNTIVLTTLAETLVMNSLIAKVLTETIFFLISWTVQKYIVFYEKAGSGQPELKETVGAGERYRVGYNAVRPKKLRACKRSDNSFRSIDSVQTQKGYSYEKTT